jgi:hypothetical protein
MYPVIEPAERAVLEEKLRTVFGSGAATTALLKIIDAVNAAPEVQVVAPLVEPQTALEVVAEEPAPEVQVVESSP